MSDIPIIYVEHEDETLRAVLDTDGYVVSIDQGCQPSVVIFDFDANPAPFPRIAHFRALFPDAPLLVISEQDDPHLVVEAVRAGAHDWVRKPLQGGELHRSIERALARRRLSLEGRSVRRFLEEQGRQTEDDRRLLNERVAAMASELQQANHQLEEAHRELRGRVAQLVMLYRIGRDLTTQRNWDDALLNLLQSLCRFLDARGGALLLRSQGGLQLATRSSFGVSEEALERATGLLKPMDFGGELEPALVCLEDLEIGEATQACIDRRSAWDWTVVPLSHGRSDVGYLVLDKTYLDGTLFAEDYYFLITIQTVLTEEVASAQAFSQLRKLQRFHERTLDNLGSGILTVDDAGQIHFANSTALRLLGAEATEAVDLDQAVRLGAESPPLRRWLAGIDESAPASIEGWMHPCDGADALPITMVASSLPGDMPGEVHHVLVIEDGRQRQALESERRRAGRQKELLIMAAEWAHDVRTPLTGILHSAELLATAVEEHSPKHRHLAVISSEVQRINELVNHFLDYARPVQVKASRQDLNTLVGDAVALLGGPASARGKRVQFKTTLENEDAFASVDRDQVKQVLLNLLQNALEASPEGGDVLVELTATKGTPVQANPIAFDELLIDVSDAGPGVPEEHIDRLFVPFFTTKPEGTGLGLAISEKVIRAHGGTLRYMRREGRTVLRVVLPRVEARMAKLEATQSEALSPELEARG